MFDSDIPFTMIFIKENKTEQLVFYKVGEKIAFILLKKFLNSLSCIEKDVV